MKMYRKISCVTIIEVLLAALAVPVAADDTNSQNTGSSWSAEAISYVSDTIMIGRDIGFEPKSNVTRAEAATVVYRMLENNVPRDRSKADLSQYTDVKTDAWYYNSMQYAVGEGIVSGYNNKLRPSDFVSREEMVTILGRMLISQNYAKFTESKSEYSDEAQISDWAKKYVDFMTNLGCIKGKGNNNFDPKATITREELAQIIYNMKPIIFFGQTEKLNMQNSEVASIELFSGNTGKKTTITDASVIEKFVNILSDAAIVKNCFNALDSAGVGYLATIKYADGESYRIEIAHTGGFLKRVNYGYDITSEPIDTSWFDSMLGK